MQDLLRPPLKIQGGKTRLIPFLREHIRPAQGRWIEPFVGAGSVALNFAPPTALLADANPHLVAFHRAVADGSITGARVRECLRREGRLLQAQGNGHYLCVRERFNSSHDPLDLLFLNHACFNGLMRFNASGAFNTPFCRQPERFTPSLVRSIASRVDAAAALFQRRGWTIEQSDWRRTLEAAGPSDFIYLDPPYAGRNAAYYSVWGEQDARELAAALMRTRAKWALSDWYSDANGVNVLLRELYGSQRILTRPHHYVVGAGAASRTRLLEALVLSR